MMSAPPEPSHGSLRARLVERARTPSGSARVRRERERERGEQETLALAKRRQSALFILLALALFALVGRAAYWQLGRHNALAARADEQTLRRISVPAGRGVIYDAGGRVLAVSVTRDTLVADPQVIRQQGALDATTNGLAQALDLAPDLLRAQLDGSGAYARLRDANSQTLWLTQGQSAQVAGLIQRGAVIGVELIPQVRRVYPDGALAAQALGFVRTGDSAGQYGVEQQYERALAGQPGEIYTAVDVRGEPVAQGQRQTPPVPGADVTLTLDASVQQWAEQGLAQAIQQTGADGGTVVALDPHTGAILALANAPSFDPNAYGQASLDAFANPAVSGVYDPGSVMKAMTMAAGIDTGAITPDSTLVDNGVVSVSGVEIHNWDRHSHGVEDMTQVLQYSANVGAVWVTQRVGQKAFDNYLASFGFGVRTGVDLPAESAGLLAAPQSSSQAALDLAENSFGESIGVTPLQMAAAYATLANGGVMMRPYIVASVTADGGLGATTRTNPQTVGRVVKAQTAQTVTQMLVTSAYASEAEMNLVKGYTVAAKTGTSTPDPGDPAITYASVAGYAPASNPRFVLLVKLNHPKSTIYGGSAAGPLWRSLAEQMFTYYRIPPDAPGSQG